MQDTSATGISFWAILGIVFVIAVIGIGIWSYKAGRYHIFYFSLCGLFCLDFFYYPKLAIRADQVIWSADIPRYEVYVTDEKELRPSSKDPDFWVVPLFEFLRVVTYSFFAMIVLLSLVNPFIQNKLAVKIVSVIMLILIGAFIYFITHMFT